MKLAELRKDDTRDMVDVRARVSADFVRAVEKAGIPVERVICAAFEEVHAKLLKEAVVDALEKPLTVTPSPTLVRKKIHKNRKFKVYIPKNGSKKLRNQSKRWTSQQLSKLAKFYHDKSNHYKSGMVRGDKLGQFARAIGKTPGSVSVKMSEIGLTKTRVFGSRRKRAPDTVQSAKGTLTRFPRLPTNVDADVTKNVVKDMINGRPFRQLDMMAVGIDNEDAWVRFVQAFIVKSTKIADYFEVPDKFYVVRSNKKGRMYSNVGYKQGKFGG